MESQLTKDPDQVLIQSKNEEQEQKFGSFELLRLVLESKQKTDEQRVNLEDEEVSIPPPAPKLRAQRLLPDFPNVFLPCSAQFIQSLDDNISSKHHCKSYNDELSRNSMDNYLKEQNFTFALNLDQINTQRRLNHQKMKHNHSIQNQGSIFTQMIENQESQQQTQNVFPQSHSTSILNKLQNVMPSSSSRNELVSQTLKIGQKMNQILSEDCLEPAKQMRQIQFNVHNQIVDNQTFLNNLLSNANNKIDNQSQNIQNSIKETIATEDELMKTPNFFSQHKKINQEYCSKSQEMEKSQKFQTCFMNENKDMSEISNCKIQKNVCFCLRQNCGCQRKIGQKQGFRHTVYDQRTFLSDQAIVKKQRITITEEDRALFQKRPVWDFMLKRAIQSKI